MLNRSITDEGSLFLATAMFVAGVFVASLLLYSTWLICRRSSGRGSGVFMIDISALALDRLVLNACLGALLLLECATVMWDTLYPVQFPVVIRGLLVLAALIGTMFSSSRLFKLYLRIDKLRQIRAQALQASVMDASPLPNEMPEKA